MDEGSANIKTRWLVSLNENTIYQLCESFLKLERLHTNFEKSQPQEKKQNDEVITTNRTLIVGPSVTSWKQK